MAEGVAAPEPEDADDVAEVQPAGSRLAAQRPEHAPLPRTALRRHSPKVGAQCGSPARWDLFGGRGAILVPTAILFKVNVCCRKTEATPKLEALALRQFRLLERQGHRARFHDHPLITAHERVRAPHGICVVGEEGTPALAERPGWPAPPVAADGAYALTAIPSLSSSPRMPSAPQVRVLARHGGDQRPDLGVQARSPQRAAGTPTREEAPGLAPAQHGPRSTASGRTRRRWCRQFRCRRRTTSQKSLSRVRRRGGRWQRRATWSCWRKRAGSRRGDARGCGGRWRGWRGGARGVR